MIEQRAEHPVARQSGWWLFGAILIVVGILLFLQNLGMTTFDNWWALFILIPAGGALTAAWRSWSAHGDWFSPAVIAPLIVGLVLLGVTAVFLFELSVNWGWVGPLLLIVIGVSVLLGGFSVRR